MKTLPQTFLQKVEKIIQENITKKALFQLLGETLNLSASQIYRKIKKQTGVSPSIYIRQKRLEQAHLLIQTSELSISEIAAWVGFQSLAYFSRCFSKYYGYSPMILRQQTISR